jgi:hypothetical protein
MANLHAHFSVYHGGGLSYLQLEHLVLSYVMGTGDAPAGRRRRTAAE